MATSYYAPDPCQSTFFLPGTNTPGAGVLVFFYTAGSSAKQTAYQDEAGSVAHANPIVLDAGGNIPGTGSVWLTAMATYDVVYAPANDTDPPASPYRTVQDISGINDVAAQTGVQWISGPAPVFVGATQFVLTGDQTADAQIGRRIQTTNTGGTIYSTISSAIFTSTTAVGVRNDSGVLDSGLSALSYGLLTPQNPSIPLLSDFYPTTMNAADKTKLYQQNLARVPSSSTVLETIPGYNFNTATQNVAASTLVASSSLNASSVLGDAVLLSGTTAISFLTLFDGQRLELQAAGSTPLNNSTTFSLLGGANMTTAAGDWMTFRGYSSSTVMEAYSRKTVLEPSVQLLYTTTAASSPALDVNSVITSMFDVYRIMLENLSPVTDNVSLQMLVSTSNGVNFVSSATYNFSAITNNSSTGVVTGDASGAGAAAINIATGVGNAVNRAFSGEIVLHRPAVNSARITWDSSYTNDGGNDVKRTGQSNTGLSGVNSMRFLFSSGNASSGALRVYGMKNS